MRVDYGAIGERLRLLRELKNVTLSQLADKTNFTTKSLLLAELGKAALNLEFLLSVCQALEVTPNDLLKGQFPEKEFTLSVREELIDDFVLRLQELEAQESPQSKTKISETERTIEQIGRMVAERRKELREGEPLDRPPTKNWSPTYFK